LNSSFTNSKSPLRTDSTISLSLMREWLPKIGKSVDVVSTLHQRVLHQSCSIAGAFGLFETLVGIPYQAHEIPFD
jgi:hypothetical protein